MPMSCSKQNLNIMGPRNLLRVSHLRPKKALGQNFLQDPSASKMIVERSKIETHDIVLEIGAGLGALTIPVAKQVNTIYAVEKDNRLLQLLKTRVLANELNNVILIKDNILKFNIERLAAAENKKLLVMGNLPYNISSQVLIKLIKSRNFVSKAVLMFQEELAQRIIAAPGSKDYSRITVMLGYCAGVTALASIKADLFYPKPKINSTVLEICFHEPPTWPAENEDLLFLVIRAAFGKRRKTLKNALAGNLLKIDGSTAISILKAAGIDPVRRAETLSVADFVLLSNYLNQYNLKKL